MKSARVAALAAVMLFTLAGTSGSAEIDLDKFYAISLSEKSTDLYAFDPDIAPGGKITYNPVTSLKLSDDRTPNFMTNTIAFSPDNKLYGWDTNSRRIGSNNTPVGQLYTIDIPTGRIDYIGSPNTNDSLGTNLINGMSFVRSGDTATLYGIAGATDKLYQINTTTGHAETVGDSYVNVKHVGMAVNFGTNELYAVSGWADGMPDYLLKITPNPTSVIKEQSYTSATMNNYSWTTKYSNDSTRSSYTGNYIHMDGTSNGAPGGNWIPAYAQAERTIAELPKSGRAKLEFTLVGNGAGQSRIVFFVKQDENNWYKFTITDQTYGSTGYTQGVTKMVNGKIVYSNIVAGSIANGSDETGNHVSSMNKNITMEAVWDPAHVKLILNGTTIVDADTTADTTILKPTKIAFMSYRFDTDWKSIVIDPGVAQIVGALGTDFNDVSTEFDENGNLYAVRDRNRLYSVNTMTGLATLVGELGTGYGPNGTFQSTNLAHPWTEAAPVPEPGTLVLLGSGLAGLAGYGRKKFRK